MKKFSRAHVSFRRPDTYNFYDDFYREMRKIGWYKRPWPGEYTSISSFSSKTKMIKAIRNIALAYVDPGEGEVSIMISEEPRGLALPRSHRDRVVHRLLQKIKSTHPADVWDALHEMCNNDAWEETTWNLARTLNVEYDVGDEYTDIITALCFGVIDNL